MAGRRSAAGVEQQGVARIDGEATSVSPIAEGLCRRRDRSARSAARHALRPRHAGTGRTRGSRDRPAACEAARARSATREPPERTASSSRPPAAARGGDRPPAPARRSAAAVAVAGSTLIRGVPTNCATAQRRPDRDRAHPATATCCSRPPMIDRDPVRHRHRLGLVVRHVEERRAELAMELGDLGAHVHAQLGVEVAERLVHQEDARPPHHGAGERHALLLAARELRRLARQQALDPQHRRRPPAPRPRSTGGRRRGARPNRRCTGVSRRMRSGTAMFSATVRCG